MSNKLAVLFISKNPTIVIPTPYGDAFFLRNRFVTSDEKLIKHLEDNAKIYRIKKSNEEVDLPINAQLENQLILAEEMAKKRNEFKDLGRVLPEGTPQVNAASTLGNPLMGSDRSPVAPQFPTVSGQNLSQSLKEKLDAARKAKDSGSK